MHIYILWIPCRFPADTGTSDVCSTPDRELPDYNDELQSINLSGGVQLLIPEYQFNCLGGIAEWKALVSLQQNVSETVEFQALRPVENNDDGVYRVTFHNEYKLDNVNGSLLTLPVEVADSDNFMIPVDCRDIVGIYLENVSHPLELLFDSAPDNESERVDVYYWEGLSQRRCLYSICDPDVKVMRGVRPFISWTVDGKIAHDLLCKNVQFILFVILGDQPITTLEFLIMNSRNSLDYCSGTNIPPICQPASSSTSAGLLSSSSFIEGKGIR